MLTRSKSQLIFGSALFLFFLNGAIATVGIFSLLDAEKWVMHTRDVQVALAQFNTVFARAGRTRAEYLDLPTSAHLQNYQAAISTVESTLAELKTLTIDNPAQQTNCSRLEQLSDQRNALLAQSVAGQESGKTTPATQSQISDKLRSLGDQIDTVTQQMYEEEQRLLDARIGRRANAARLAIASLALSFSIAAVLFVFDYRSLNKQLVERQNAHAALQKLSARILSLQDEERRKFSRELHDSMGQLLVSIKMSLDLLAIEKPEDSSIKNCSDLLEQALRETRSISYLLHPPLLDQAGFASAASEYVEGFSKRSGISVTLKMNPNRNGTRLSPPIELAMFRVLQESLTNILKHSNSSEVVITLSYLPLQVSLTIQDNGHGMPADVLQQFRNDGAGLGVGLAGMRERMRLLNGHLEVESNSNGTTVTAILPRAAEDPPILASDELVARGPV